MAPETKDSEPKDSQPNDFKFSANNKESDSRRNGNTLIGNGQHILPGLGKQNFSKRLFGQSRMGSAVGSTGVPHLGSEEESDLERGDIDQRNVTVEEHRSGVEADGDDNTITNTSTHADSTRDELEAQSPFPCTFC